MQVIDAIVASNRHRLKGSSPKLVGRHNARQSSGTRYQRLAALMFKILDDRNVVIHGLRLAGKSG